MADDARKAGEAGKASAAGGSPSKPKTEERDREKESSSSSDEGDLDDMPEDLLRKMLQMRLNKGDANKEHPKVLSSVSFSGIVDYIRSGKAKHIITMAGAGISTSAGIPDFRSPKTGVYANMKAKFGDAITDPTDVFSIEFFQRDPRPFYTLAREMFVSPSGSAFSPTQCHFFVRLLNERGLLLRHYTQNVDALERAAGIDADKIVEAHGTVHTGHCVKKECNEQYSQQWIKDQMSSVEVPLCSKCKSPVKPDIVFFGEGLPERFFACAKEDFDKADLLIIMGTSLTVQPFASLINRVPSTCPRLLINLTKAGNDGTDYVLRLLGGGGLDFDSEDNYRDVAWLGLCDDGCAQLAKDLGWEAELEALTKKHLKKEEAKSKV